MLKVKQIWELFKKENHRLWTSITVRIEDLKFEIEYNYEKLNYEKYSNMERHIIWKYNNLGLPEEAFTSKERKLIRNYVNETIYFRPDIEKYSESIYKNPVKKIVDYNKEKKSRYIFLKQKCKNWKNKLKINLRNNAIHTK